MAAAPLRSSDQPLPVRRRWVRFVAHIIASGAISFSCLYIASVIVATTQLRSRESVIVAWAFLIGTWLLILAACGAFWAYLLRGVAVRFSTQGIWRLTRQPPRRIPWSAIQQVDFFIDSFFLTTASQRVVLPVDGFRRPEAIKALIESQVPPGTPLLYLLDPPPEQCPTCQHQDVHVDIGIANRTGAAITHFGSGNLSQRLTLVFFGSMLSVPFIAGFLPQIGLVPSLPRVFAGVLLLIVSLSLVVIIRDGIYGTRALRGRCAHCGTTWLRRGGERRQLQQKSR